MFEWQQASSKKNRFCRRFWYLMSKLLSRSLLGNVLRAKYLFILSRPCYEARRVGSQANLNFIKLWVRNGDLKYILIFLQDHLPLYMSNDHYLVSPLLLLIYSQQDQQSYRFAHAFQRSRNHFRHHWKSSNFQFFTVDISNAGNSVGKGF